MAEFIVRLADLPIQVRVLYESTRTYCADYLEEGDVSTAFQVDIGQAEIDAERAISDYREGLEGRPPRNSPDAYLETLALYRAIAERLPAHDVVLMHGSAIALDGVAYLFTGRSGAGKSTHVRLWREKFGERTVMINDDKPLLRVNADGGVTIYGTPWNGKHRLSTNTSAPLKAICLISQAERNGVERLDERESWNVVMKQIYRPRDPRSGMLTQTLQLVDRIAAAVPIYNAQCTLDDEIVPLVHAALSGSSTPGICDSPEA